MAPTESRTEMTTAKKPATQRDICGTYKGWNAHKRNNEDTCPPCQQAQTDYARDWRHRTGRSTSQLYSHADIAAIKAEALREAANEAMWGAYGKNWLTTRAKEIEATA
jgi:hypothetical protein